MTTPAFTHDAPAFPPRRAVELDPEAQRREAMLDEPINVGRIADALERIADVIAAALAEPEPEPDERTGEPEPEPPIDEWEPVKGGRAWLPTVSGRRVPVIVDRIFESEGEAWAVVVDEAGNEHRVSLDVLEPPR